MTDASALPTISAITQTDPDLWMTLQPRIATALKQAAAANTAHAYLFEGPIGHLTYDAALWFASQLLAPRSEPGKAGGAAHDGSSNAIQRVLRGTHPDLHVLMPEGRTIRIDETRVIPQVTSMKPFEAERQVVIIESADTIDYTNAAAGNALLKVIEEPTGDVIFILLANRSSRMLETIKSRVIRTVFPPIAPEAMVEAFAGSHSADALDRARASRGDVMAYTNYMGMHADARDWWSDRTVILDTLASLCNAGLHPHEFAKKITDVAAEEEQLAHAKAEHHFEQMMLTMAPKEATRFKNTSDSDGMEKRIRRIVSRRRFETMIRILDEMRFWYRDLAAVSNGAEMSSGDTSLAASLTALASSPAATHAFAALDVLDDLAFRLESPVDQVIALESACAELASLAAGRIRSRRTFGGAARSRQGYDLAL